MGYPYSFILIGYRYVFTIYCISFWYLLLFDMRNVASSSCQLGSLGQYRDGQQSLYAKDASRLSCSSCPVFCCYAQCVTLYASTASESDDPGPRRRFIHKLLTFDHSSYTNPTTIKFSSDLSTLQKTFYLEDSCRIDVLVSTDPADPSCFYFHKY